LLINLPASDYVTVTSVGFFTYFIAADKRAKVTTPLIVTRRVWALWLITMFVLLGNGLLPILSNVFLPIITTLFVVKNSKPQQIIFLFKW
jgi:hypothetical protein